MFTTLVKLCTTATYNILSAIVEKNVLLHLYRFLVFDKIKLRFFFVSF